MLIFPNNANAVDLTSVVRDSLVLALPVQPRCAEAACASRASATVATAATAPPAGAAGPWAALAALRQRMDTAA